MTSASGKSKSRFSRDMTGLEGEVFVARVDMTVTCEEDCCGLFKILDRRHDKTNTVKDKI